MQIVAIADYNHARGFFTWKRQNIEICSQDPWRESAYVCECVCVCMCVYVCLLWAKTKLEIKYNIRN